MLATGSLGRPGLEIAPPPGFNLPAESYNRLVRLMKRGVAVKLEVELESAFYDRNGHTSVLADIPGSSRRNEVVLVGAHLDSWHVGTGAADNGVNVAIVMEAMRILKDLRLPLARTVRMALWAAEERGLRGSRAYVRDFQRAGMEKHFLYFNLDSGGGRIRGLQIQGRNEWLPIVDRWLSPFKASEQAYVSIRRTLGSDQSSFESAGLSSMVLIQDPGFYGRTYHANVDVLDYLPEAELKESAATLAAILWQAANEDSISR
jgi:Zn-dependent M28 family amino/carboxypeptidase